MKPQHTPRNGHGTGRLPAVDLRDHAYRFSHPAIKNQLGVVKKRLSRYWDVPDILPVDQGQTPHCVGHSAATCLVCGPVHQRTILSTLDAEAMGEKTYWTALTLDEWPGEVDQGTSVRAGQKALQQFGFIKNYLWAFTVPEAVEFLLAHGPIIFGTVFPYSMDRPDENGFLRVDGSTLSDPEIGGHAYCGTGCDTRKFCPHTGDKGAFRIENSWGRGWGLDGKGQAWIAFSDMAKLLAAGGEVAMPTEMNIRKVAA